MWNKFESSVNSEGIETEPLSNSTILQFESSVNSEGIETFPRVEYPHKQFESSVNSEGIETGVDKFTAHKGLRAV